MSIQIEGLDKVIKLLEDMGNPEKLDASLGKACAVVEASAKQKAPKDNGDLRRSIASKVEGNDGIVYSTLEYAPYVEYGTGLFAEKGGRKDVPWVYQDDEGHWHSTRGQRPQPYMRPALDENRAKILQILMEGLTND